MKSKRSLFLLFSANIISGFATGITFISVPWYLVSTFGETDGKLRNALMMGVVTLVSLIWGIYVGTLIDKYNRKRIFQFQTLISGTILLVSSLLGFWFGAPPFLVVGLVAMTTTLTFNVHYPNLYAFVQELFAPQYYQAVNSAIEVQGQVTNFLGMTAAGLFMAGTKEFSWWPQFLEMEPWNMQEIFLLDGITYFCAFSLISFIRYTPGEYMQQASGNVWRRIRLGMGYLFERKPLLVFGLASYTLFFTLLVFIKVALHIYVNDYLDAGKLTGAKLVTQFEAIFAIGAGLTGIAGLVFSKRDNKNTLIRLVIALLLLGAGVYIALSFTKIGWVLVAGGFVMGITNSGIRILRTTYISLMVSNSYIGRVHSFFQMANVSMRAIFIFALALPFFSDAGNGENIIFATLAMALFCIISAILLLIYFPKFNQIDPEE